MESISNTSAVGKKKKGKKERKIWMKESFLLLKREPRSARLLEVFR